MINPDPNQNRQAQVGQQRPISERYKWVPSEVIQTPTSRLVVRDLLGSGTFSTVLLCTKTSNATLDGRPVRQQTEDVALKILKTNSRLMGEAEYGILSTLKDNHAILHSCLIVHEAFIHESHYCLVFEKLDTSLADYLNRLRPNMRVSLDNLKIIMKDVLTALKFLQQLGMVHTDLKTTNIALIDHKNKPFHVKLIDFGCTLTSAELPRMQNRFNLQTLHYRSPEILLKYSPYNEAIDMWSLGVVMLELLTINQNLKHRLLYNSTSEYDQMRHMVEGQGMPPKEILDRAQGTTTYFCKTRGGQGWRLLTPDEYFQSSECQKKGTQRKFVTLEEPELLDGFGSVAFNKEYNQSINMKLDTQKRRNCGNLLNRMLEMDPVERITPSEALQHPFFASLGKIKIPIVF